MPLHIYRLYSYKAFCKKSFWLFFFEIGTPLYSGMALNSVWSWGDFEFLVLLPSLPSCQNQRHQLLSPDLDSLLIFRSGFLSLLLHCRSSFYTLDISPAYHNTITDGGQRTPWSVLFYCVCPRDQSQAITFTHWAISQPPEGFSVNESNWLIFNQSLDDWVSYLRMYYQI